MSNFRWEPCQEKCSLTLLVWGENSKLLFFVKSLQTNLQRLEGWFALTIVVASESSYWERPCHILKPMKTFICKQKVCQKFLTSCLTSVPPINVLFLFKTYTHFGAPKKWIWRWFYEKWKFWLFKNVLLSFKHILCINPSKNEHDCHISNFLTHTPHGIIIWGVFWVTFELKSPL